MKCPNCGHQTPSHAAKLRALFAARVERPARINRRNIDAAHNELVTAVHAARAEDAAGVVSAPEDVVDPRSTPGVPIGPGIFSMEWFARGLGLRNGGAQ